MEIDIMGIAIDRIRVVLSGLLAALAVAVPAQAVEPGRKAPDFTLPDTNGRPVHLADFAGRIVVLEWTNHECPFVRAHYDSGVMQALQAEAKQDGAVWLSVVSSAPGKQGYVDGTEGNAVMLRDHAVPTAKLLDPAGTVGHLYDAKTTPDIVVIDKAGAVAYMGAIDDRDTADADEARQANGNLVRAALTAVEHGKSVEKPATVSYGCSIKYGS
jgi:peroxiredoxin